MISIKLYDWHDNLRRRRFFHLIFCGPVANEMTPTRIPGSHVCLWLGSTWKKKRKNRMNWSHQSLRQMSSDISYVFLWIIFSSLPGKSYRLLRIFCNGESVLAHFIFIVIVIIFFCFCWCCSGWRCHIENVIRFSLFPVDPIYRKRPFFTAAIFSFSCAWLAPRANVVIAWTSCPDHI